MSVIQRRCLISSRAGVTVATLFLRSVGFEEFYDLGVTPLFGYFKCCPVMRARSFLLLDDVGVFHTFDDKGAFHTIVYDLPGRGQAFLKNDFHVT